MSKNIEEKAFEKYPPTKIKTESGSITYGNSNQRIAFIDGYKTCQKEYEDKLRWIPIDELYNPTIPFLGKDKSGRIELFKVANVFYLKALDVVEWRSIL